MKARPATEAPTEELRATGGRRARKPGAEAGAAAATATAAPRAVLTCSLPGPAGQQGGHPPLRRGSGSSAQGQARRGGAATRRLRRAGGGTEAPRRLSALLSGKKAVTPSSKPSLCRQRSPPQSTRFQTHPTSSESKPPAGRMHPGPRTQPHSQASILASPPPMRGNERVCLHFKLKIKIKRRSRSLPADSPPARSRRDAPSTR